MKVVVAAVLLLAAIPMLGGTARAQVPSMHVDITVVGDKGTAHGGPADLKLTFSAPIQIPNVVLPAGSYLFRTVAPLLMQVTSDDGSRIYSLFFVTPIQRNPRMTAYRSEATDDLTVTLRRTRLTAPPRLTEFFGPGRTRGYSLVYGDIDNASGN